MALRKVIAKRRGWQWVYAPVFLLPRSVQNVEQRDLVIDNTLLAV